MLHGAAPAPLWHGQGGVAPHVGFLIAEDKQYVVIQRAAAPAGGVGVKRKHILRGGGAYSGGRGSLSNNVSTLNSGT